MLTLMLTAFDSERPAVLAVWCVVKESLVCWQHSLWLRASTGCWSSNMAFRREGPTLMACGSEEPDMRAVWT